MVDLVVAGSRPLGDTISTSYGFSPPGEVVPEDLRVRVGEAAGVDVARGRTVSAQVGVADAGDAQFSNSL